MFVTNKFAAFNLKGLSPSAKKQVNGATITKGTPDKDGIVPITVVIAGSKLGPFKGLQKAHDETRKWLMRNFPKSSKDSVDAIAEKYGREMVQIDAVTSGKNPGRDSARQKLRTECDKFNKMADKILTMAKEYKSKYGNGDWVDSVWIAIQRANNGHSMI